MEAHGSTNWLRDFLAGAVGGNYSHYRFLFYSRLRAWLLYHSVIQWLNTHCYNNESLSLSLCLCLCLSLSPSLSLSLSPRINQLLNRAYNIRLWNCRVYLCL